MFYCPRCATSAVPGQRHCKNCGIKLDVIQDAIEGRQRSPLDFDTLKKDLRDLGASLRTGFEEASIKIKQTQKLGKNAGKVGQPASLNLPNWSKEFDRALRKVKAAHTRKYSLQQATLSLFGGGAIMTVWYFLLKAAVESGLLQNLELLILDLTGTRVAGLAQFVQLLWLLGFIPIGHGVAHLVNAIFFAPGKIEEPQEQIKAAPPQETIYSSPVATSELPDEPAAPRPSVTEEETVRLEQR
ncbi:MAG: zinc ribbon domain-containing protein [Blastocatellia bacterium]|nr:zinc ribbon domain-containing protein [Blastocatellia bacterium]